MGDRRAMWTAAPGRSTGLRALGRRAHRVGLLVVLTGAVVGLAVALFDRLVGASFDHLLDAPLWLQAIGPVIGLTLAAVLLRFAARGATPATADEYIKDFHEPDRRLDLAPVPGRLLAGAATLGSGAAMGFEGPSIYIGAACGSWLQHRFSRLFARTDNKLLLVCGAAAGVAAIFKAPATGLVFALEVPYRQDLARRMLLPAMFAAAVSYVAFVAVNGTTPLFPVAGAPPLDWRDLGGAGLVGLLCGGGARLFAAVLTAAKAAAARTSVPRRLAIAGGASVATFVLIRLITGESLAIGSGYRTINWALEPHHAVLAIVAVFGLRAVATSAAVVGGGVGGLFVPLVVQGAVLGSAISAVLGISDRTLFPLLGVAAFLGAGYRVPLAAVMFVAESTGRPGFVVPALIAAASSQVLMGRSSVSPYQRGVRAGLLERRLALPVSAALRTDVATVASQRSVADLVRYHITEMRLRVVPVVDAGLFQGVVGLGDIARLPPEQWATTTVGELAHRDWPVGDTTATLGAALAVMERHDVDQLPIVGDGRLLGMVTTAEILRLDEILDTAHQDRSSTQTPPRPLARAIPGRRPRRFDRSPP